MRFIPQLQRIPMANLSLLLSVLLVILPQLPRLPLWLSLLCLAVLGWRLLFDMGRVRLPNRILRFGLVILSILGLIVSYHTIVGREAGTALLILMLSLKLLEMQGQRDVTVVIFLGFFVIVTGFLFSQSIFIALYMLLAVTLLVATLIAFQHRQQTINPSAFKQHIFLALRLLLQAAPLALLLFVLFPRVPGPLWGLPEDTSAKTGLSDEMQPGDISNLVNSEEVAFRVRFANRIPPPGQRYWRGPVFWQYDGQKWRANTRKTGLHRQYDFDIEGQPVDYQVTLEPHNRHWLFALDLPATVPDDARFTSDFQVISRKSISEIYRYRMRSYPDYRLDNRQVPDLDRYLAIPDRSAIRTRQLVKQLRQQHPTNAGFVTGVLNYFSQQPFFYSRKAPLLFDHPVDEFLFETRKGYCEHYASAFTVMMRLAGIPARVVTGYQGGEMNPLSDYMIVRQSDAHAWSEVWLEQRGWVRFDPTSVIPPSRIELTEDLVRRRPQTRSTIILEQNWIQQSLRQAGYAWDALNNRWNQWVIGYNQDRQNALFAALGLENITWHGLAVILLVCVTLVVLILAFLLFARTAHAGNNRIIMLYQRFLRHLARRGYRKQPQETPSQFSQRVIRQQPDLAEIVSHITRYYLQLRYAAVNEQQKQQLIKQMRQSLRQLIITG